MQTFAKEPSDETKRHKAMSAYERLNGLMVISTEPEQSSVNGGADAGGGIVAICVSDVFAPPT